MLLAIDVGNTNIVLGVFDATTLVRSWRLQTLRERTSDELGLLVDGLFAYNRIERTQVRGVVLGSVVRFCTRILPKSARIESSTRLPRMSRSGATARAR